MSIAVTASGISYADDGKDKHDGIDPSRVQQGFDASPIPKDQLNFKGKDPYLVGLGAYLVNAAADCNGCHTFPRFLRPGKPGNHPQYGDPYLDAPPSVPPQSLTGQLTANTNITHFLAGGRCFGAFQSRNLTPDDSGKPRGLTEAEFIQVMRTGKDVSCSKPNPPKYGGVTDPVCSIPDPPGAGVTYNPDVLQTMSWPTYHSMTDTDLKAIYAYLSALPQTTACNTGNLGCAGFNDQNGTPYPKGPTPPGFYAYDLSNTDPTCPNPPTPQ